MDGSNLRFSPDDKFDNNQHICGTLNMGNDPAKSVCDKLGAASTTTKISFLPAGRLPTAGT